MSYEIKSIKDFDFNTKDSTPKKYRYVDQEGYMNITNRRSDIPTNAKEIDESTKVTEWKYNLITWK